MGSAFCLLVAVCLPGQSPCYSGGPPHQQLWTCSSLLKWHNYMDCHEVQDKRLPVLDCACRALDRLCPRHRQPVPYYDVRPIPEMNWRELQSGPGIQGPSPSETIVEIR